MSSNLIDIVEQLREIGFTSDEAWDYAEQAIDLSENGTLDYLAKVQLIESLEGEKRQYKTLA